MPNRRLVLAREVLTPLQSDELALVSGGISRPNTICEITHTICQATSLANSYCPDTTCGFACTADCNTQNCG